jgi:hypothetical protein
MRMRLSRDSVAAGDDVESHDEIREVDPRRPLERLVRELHRDHYLASIQGGRATWIVRTSKNGEALAVFGTRYGDADTFRLVKRTGMDLSEVGESLHFEFARHDDADSVLASLQ